MSIGNMDKSTVLAVSNSGLTVLLAKNKLSRSVIKHESLLLSFKHMLPIKELGSVGPPRSDQGDLDEGKRSLITVATL